MNSSGRGAGFKIEEKRPIASAGFRDLVILIGLHPFALIAGHVAHAEPKVAVLDFNSPRRSYLNISRGHSRIIDFSSQLPFNEILCFLIKCGTRHVGTVELKLTDTLRDIIQLK